MKFLVHLHIYYHEQLDYFLNKLSNIQGCEWDLYVTYVDENSETINKIKAFKPDVVLKKVENRGYDVLPFINVIRDVNLNDYDYVLKLHTKNYIDNTIGLFSCKKRHFKGFFWRNELVNALIGSKRQFRQNLKLLQNNNDIGMITSKLFYLPTLVGNKIPEDTFLIYNLMKRLGVKSKIHNFCAGTMFIIKCEPLKLLADSDINESEFPDYSKSSGSGTIAHTLERIYAMLVDMCGYKVFPVKTAAYLMAKIQRFGHYNILQNIFSIKKSMDKSYKTIKILGIKFIKHRPVKYPKNSICYKNVYVSSENIKYENKRAAVFAMFFKDGKISDNAVKYLKELRKYNDYIIVVSDCPILPDEKDSLKGLADAVIFERHGEYDFGSYKRGFLMLKELGVTDKIESLLFCNESVEFVADSLCEVFDKSAGSDFYGMIPNNQGIYVNKKLIKNPHIQSWFVMFSGKIFRSDWFYDFIKCVKKEKIKEKIIANYELGMSKLITDHGFQINSYYPVHDDIFFNPDFLYANPNNKFEKCIFAKKRFLTE